MNILAKLFHSKKCFFCKKKIKPFTAYENDKGEHIHVCSLCKEYAERRLFKGL